MPRAMISKGTDISTVRGEALPPTEPIDHKIGSFRPYQEEVYPNLARLSSYVTEGGGKRIPASSALTALAEFELEFLSSVRTDFPLS